MPDMKRKQFLYLLMGCLLVSEIACGQSKTHPHCGSKVFDATVSTLLQFTVPTISCTELSKHQQDYVLLDARERSEYDVSHIKGAQHVGYEGFNEKNVNNIPKNKPIVVYCSIGYRSEKIGEKLQAMGFKNVQNLYGSIFEWVNKGFSVVDSTGAQTNRIHTYNAQWAQYVSNKKMQKEH